MNVYVINGGRRHVKVGVARDVRLRLKGLQTGCPFTLHKLQEVRACPCHRLHRQPHRSSAHAQGSCQHLSSPTKPRTTKRDQEKRPFHGHNQYLEIKPSTWCVALPQKLVHNKSSLHKQAQRAKRCAISRRHSLATDHRKPQTQPERSRTAEKHLVSLPCALT